MSARDFSKAGETFIDYNGKINQIVYSIMTPLGYQVYVSAQRLQHLEKHPVAARHKNHVPHILNNPDVVTPNPDDRETHIFYKSFYGKLLLAVPVHLKDELRFAATMYDTEYIKGIKQKLLLPSEFLYLRGGFKWKQWK
ncbi:MAG: hypothetical protein AAB354_05570 [candidate division KSB1 bacterium]